MPRTRWIVLGAALVLIAASLLGGRGSGAGRDLVWADGAMGARQGGADQYIVERWNQLHPMGPRVRIEPMPESPDDQHQQMAMALAAKSSDLDILTLDLVWTGEFAREHWLVDLKGIRPQIKAVSLTATVQSATWDNKLWAAPSTTDAGLLYYRKDLVGDLSGHEPKTWEELFELGLRVGREHGIAPFVGQGAPYEGMVVNYLEYLWSFGGDLFSADGTQVRFEDGPAIKAIELMRRGLHSGFYAPGFNAMKEEEARNAFQSGKAVFLRNWPYVYPLICEHDNCPFGVAPLPGVPALGGHNLAVSAFSHNQPAAKEFARFVSTTFDVQRDIASKFSLAPTMGSVYDTLRDKPVMLQLSRSLREARPRPATPDWAEISTKMQEEIFRAYNGEETPQQAVDAIRAFLKTKTAKS